MICCIFGGADIEDYSHACIPEGALVVAADKGYMHCMHLNIKPDLIIGDFDSFTGEMPDDIRVIRAPEEKDDTDTILAIRIAAEEYDCDEFHIYGALGGRMGHTVASIQMLSFIAELGAYGVLYSDNCEMHLLCEGVHIFENAGCEYVSLFSMTESSEITLSGLKYSGQLTVKNSFPVGVSNEFTSDGRCRIEVIKGSLLAVFEKSNKFFYEE